MNGPISMIAIGYIMQYVVVVNKGVSLEMVNEKKDSSSTISMILSMDDQS